MDISKVESYFCGNQVEIRIFFCVENTTDFVIRDAVLRIPSGEKYSSAFPQLNGRRSNDEFATLIFPNVFFVLEDGTELTFSVAWGKPTFYLKYKYIFKNKIWRRIGSQ